MRSSGSRLPHAVPKRECLTVHRHDRESIIQIASRIFGDRSKADDWLHRPSLQLGGRTPLEVVETEDGARRVEELLAQIDDDIRLGID